MLNEFLKNALEIHTITSDSGSEFTNKKVMKWFKEHDIETFFVVGDSHVLGILNRFHRTLKNKLLNYFTSEDTFKWVDVIDKIIYNYNRTRNRGIGFTPLEASKHLIQSIIINNKRDKTTKIDDFESNNLKVGEYCRIKTDANIFDKLKAKYSNDVFRIIKIGKTRLHIIPYEQEDEDNNIISIKKDNIIIVDKPEKITNDTNRKKAEQQNKYAKKLKKELYQLS
jgi:hypothetical protein